MKSVVEFDSETGKKTVKEEFPYYDLILYRYPEQEIHFAFIYKGEVPSNDTIQLFINANMELLELKPYEQKLLNY